jgi:hypothetical protein
MSDQDDLFKQEVEQKPAESVDERADKKTTDSAAEQPTLGVDDVAGEGIAAGEVRVVEAPQRKSSSAAYLLVLLVLLALFAGGYYLIENLSSQQLASEQVVPQPKRFAIEREVVEEVLPQQDIASVSQSPPAVKAPVAKAPAQKLPSSAKSSPYQVLVGPYLSKAGADNAAREMKRLGYATEQTKGRGKVKLIRLLEGIYPREEANRRIAEVKSRVGDAFMLSTGGKWAIYVGSFTELERAERRVEQLAAKGVNVTPVSSLVEMNGRMIVAARGEQQEAQATAEKIQAAGYRAQVVRK